MEGSTRQPRIVAPTKQHQRMSKPRVLSLFAGIGGFDLGLERAGMEVVGQCEIDPFCRQVLRKHWPDCWQWDDVRTLTGDVVREHCGHVDVICGGYPCQGESIAGKKGGADDERWMWPEYIRLVRDLQPRIALMENVENHVRQSFHIVAGDLAGAGYALEWATLSAADVGGHFKGMRLFGVATAMCERVPRYFPDERPRFIGQRWPGSEKDLRDAIENPLRQSSGFDSPVLLRSSDGIPQRVDRTRALGNAIVPQCAEWVGRCVMRAMFNNNTSGPRCAAGVALRIETRVPPSQPATQPTPRQTTSALAPPPPR